MSPSQIRRSQDSNQSRLVAGHADQSLRVEPGTVSAPLVLVPAFRAERTIARVVFELRELWPARDPLVIVVDDGSDDKTGEVARDAGARVVVHDRNRGKGASIRTGLRMARDLGFDSVVTVDADGQHPASEAVRLANVPCARPSIVLGVRRMKAVGAPKANQFSNAISNFFLSRFTGLPLEDTQCGLRRYPVASVLALDTRSTGYAFEAEVLLRAAMAGIPVVQVPVHVVYDLHEHTSHFHVARDPARIIVRVLHTLARNGLERRMH